MLQRAIYANKDENEAKNSVLVSWYLVELCLEKKKFIDVGTLCVN